MVTTQQLSLGVNLLLFMPLTNYCLGTYDDQINQTGWSYLQLTTNRNVDDHQAMFAAGFLEGALTWERILQFNYTYQVSQFDPSGCSHAVRTFVRESDAWMRKMVKNNAAHDNFWYHVGLVLSQLDGLSDAIRLRPHDAAKSRRCYPAELMGDMIDFKNDSIRNRDPTGCTSPRADALSA